MPSETTEKKASTLSKFLAIGSKPTQDTFPELPEALTWMRLVMAIGYGLSLGANVTQGAIPILYALNFMTFGPILYAVVVLQADNDSYGNTLLFAGLHNSIALVLLIWIYFYTKAHENEEMALTGLLQAIQQKKQQAMDEAGAAGEGAAAQEFEATPPREESEF